MDIFNYVDILSVNNISFGTLTLAYIEYALVTGMLDKISIYLSK